MADFRSTFQICIEIEKPAPKVEDVSWNVKNGL